MRPSAATVGPAQRWPAGARQRREIIAASDKPDCLVIDTVGLGDLRLAASVAELLEGCEADHPAVLLAKRRAAKAGGATDMAAAVAAAKGELWQAAVASLLAERSKLVAAGRWHWQPTDPFGGGTTAAPTKARAAKEPATAGQVKFLVYGFGVSPDEARGYSRGQAGAVINKLKGQRCTTWQARDLGRAGLDPKGFNFAAAAAALGQNNGRLVG
jgi:hypothetical protein